MQKFDLREGVIPSSETTMLQDVWVMKVPVRRTGVIDDCNGKFYAYIVDEELGEEPVKIKEREFHVLRNAEEYLRVEMAKLT